LTLRSGLTRPSLFGAGNQSFRHLCEHDLPCAVRAVLERTGHPQLDLVGYSMGGMVMYGSLGRTLDPALLRRALIYAAPGIVPRLRLLAWARYLPRSLTPTVPLRILMRTFAFAHAVLPSFTKRIFYNPQNVSPEIARRVMFELFEDIPGRLGADFVRWAADGGRLSLHGSPLLDGLREIDVPACFFAGTADLLAPPESVRAAFDAWGADVPHCQKALLLLGRDTGTEHDYGHGDFALGADAPRDVFAPAARFLAVGPRALDLAPGVRAA
jgi:pimeloyl-ACP methyl ester carboxylesterase